MAEHTPTHTPSDVTLPAGTPLQAYIDGRWVDAEGGATFGVLDPATGEEIARVADATPADAVRALDAAVAAQAAWARTAPRERGEILRRAWEIVQERRTDLARLMTIEMGKPLAEADGEVTYGGEFLRWFAEEAVRVQGRYAPAPEGTARQLVNRRPVGPCLFILPWNFPLAMGTRKIAPALAAGCTVVVRPATNTPLTTLLLVQILEEAGVPRGVVNVVPSSSAAEVTGPLIADPRLRKLSFTGSTGVGRTLLKQAADNVLRTSMELGGNAPFLVFEDADVDAAVDGAHKAKLRNMGEACTAANRFLVHESVAEEFTAKLAEKFASLRVGHGLADGTDVGPIITEKARADIHALVTDAVADGATLATGGEPADGPGYFYPPTVLGGVPHDARILGEEIFGPVAPVTTFATEEEALALANDSQVGLAGYVYTRDMDRVLRMGDLLETGMIAVNQGLLSNAAAPFGGVKQSGLGREGGAEGIAEYLETVYLALPDPYSA